MDRRGWGNGVTWLTEWEMECCREEIIEWMTFILKQRIQSWDLLVALTILPSPPILIFIVSILFSLVWHQGDHSTNSLPYTGKWINKQARSLTQKTWDNFSYCPDEKNIQMGSSMLQYARAHTHTRMSPPREQRPEFVHVKVCPRATCTSGQNMKSWAVNECS